MTAGVPLSDTFLEAVLELPPASVERAPLAEIRSPTGWVLRVLSAKMLKLSF